MYNHKSFQKKSKLAKRSKSTKRRNNYNKSRKSKLIIGGGNGLHYKEGLEIDRLPNGVFTQLKKYMSSNIRESFKYKVAEILIILYKIINPDQLDKLKKINEVDYKNFFTDFFEDGLYLAFDHLRLNLDNPHSQNCWFKIANENPLSVNIKIDRIVGQGVNPELYGLDSILKYTPEKFLTVIFERFKRDEKFWEFTLIYCSKEPKRPLFMVKVEKIDESGSKRFRFHIYLVDDSGNEIRPYNNTALQNVAEGAEEAESN